MIPLISAEVRPALINSKTSSTRDLAAVLDFSNSAIVAHGTEDSAVAGVHSVEDELAVDDEVPLQFEARGGEIYANGQVFRFRGINWFGSEGRTGAPFGLDHHDVDW